MFHIKDLASLWDISNANTLRITLKRYEETGLLHRIHRGFYSLIPAEELSPALLGAKAIHHFCYLSTETILYQAGMISQKIEAYTFVSERSRRFTIADFYFKSRQLKAQYLYQSEGIRLINGVQQANPERAMADLLYFNPHYHFDKPVDWIKIKQIQKKIGYPLTPHRYDPA